MTSNRLLPGAKIDCAHFREWNQTVLDRSRHLDALKRLEERAAGADLALVFFAGHGMAAGDVNILGPVDAGVDCSRSGVTNVVPVEGILVATRPARHKLIILESEW